MEAVHPSETSFFSRLHGTISKKAVISMQNVGQKARREETYLETQL
jgi:hypothetical protein